jgi:hypothetical protein
MKKTFFLLIAVAMIISQLGISVIAQNRVEHGLNKGGSADETSLFGGAGRVGAAATTGGTAATSALVNHGGPVMNLPIIYIIWYGNWNQTNGSDTPAGQQIIRDWAANIGNSPHFQLNASYPPAGSISGQVSFGGETTDTGTSTRLTDTNIKTIVSNAITSGRLPKSTSGIYFVVTSSNVTASSGFCTQYCGWHTHATISTSDIKYSFVGNAKRCLSGCAAQTTVSPNGNPGIDGSISVMTHELEEATSDPDLNAWYDSTGAENGDKCAWTFGHFQYTVANGSFANMRLGSRDFLIQRNLWKSGTSWFCMVDSAHN